MNRSKRSMSKETGQRIGGILRNWFGVIARRSGLKPYLIDFFDQFSIPHNMSTGNLALDARRFVGRSSKNLQASPDSRFQGDVLFFGIRAMSLHVPYMAGLMASAIRVRGAAPCAVLCDEVLPMCESVAITDYGTRDDLSIRSSLPVCSKCFSPAAQILSAFGIPTLYLSRHISGSTIARAEETTRGLSLERILSFKSSALDLGEQVRASLYRFFLTGTITDDEFTRSVAERYLTAAICVAEATKEIILDLKPIRLVAHHGIYLISGTACEVARSLGVGVVTWDSTYRRNTVIMSHNETYHHELRKEPWSCWETLALSDEQDSRLNSYLRSRRSGGVLQDYVSYHPHPISDQRVIAQEIGQNNARRLVVLFTNVAWDGRVHVPDGVFAGPIEWVIETIRRLADRPEIGLVIRIHPAEVKHGMWVAQQRLDTEIERVFPVLPSNVVVVPPESDLDSYTLAEMADVVIVYSTKMGLECALMGLPLIIAGDAFFSNKGFGIQPRTLDEYFQCLDNVHQLRKPSSAEMERVLRYAYHYYFRRALQLPTLSYDPVAPIARSLADLLPGKLSGVDAVCAGILENAPFVDRSQ